MLYKRKKTLRLEVLEILFLVVLAAMVIMGPVLARPLPFAVATVPE